MSIEDKCTRREMLKKIPPLFVGTLMLAGVEVACGDPQSNFDEETQKKINEHLNTTVTLDNIIQGSLLNPSSITTERAGQLEVNQYILFGRNGSFLYGYGLNQTDTINNQSFPSDPLVGSLSLEALAEQSKSDLQIQYFVSLTMYPLAPQLNTNNGNAYPIIISAQLNTSPTTQ